MTNEKIPIFIGGENIDLVPLNIENIKLYAKWENSPDVRIYSRNILPRTLEEMKKYLEPSDKRPKNEVSFEIRHKKDNWLWRGGRYQLVQPTSVYRFDYWRARLLGAKNWRRSYKAIS